MFSSQKSYKLTNRIYQRYLRTADHDVGSIFKQEDFNNLVKLSVFDIRISKYLQRYAK